MCTTHGLFMFIQEYGLNELDPNRSYSCLGIAYSNHIHLVGFGLHLGLVCFLVFRVIDGTLLQRIEVATSCKQ